MRVSNSLLCTCGLPVGYLWAVSIEYSWEVRRPALEGMFPELQHVKKDLQAVARAAADIMSSLESGVNHLAGLLPPPLPAAVHIHVDPPMPASAPAGAHSKAPFHSKQQRAQLWRHAASLAIWPESKAQNNSERLVMLSGPSGGNSSVATSDRYSLRSHQAVQGPQSAPLGLQVRCFSKVPKFMTSNGPSIVEFVDIGQGEGDITNYLSHATQAAGGIDSKGAGSAGHWLRLGAPLDIPESPDFASLHTGGMTPPGWATPRGACLGAPATPATPTSLRRQSLFADLAIIFYTDGHMVHGARCVTCLTSDQSH